MVDALNNLDAVYAKWENKNPYTQNGKLPALADSFSANECDAVVAKGREEWRSRFGNISAPPQRRNRKQGHCSNKNRDAHPAAFHMNQNLGASFKTSPSYYPSSGRLRPYAGRCCDCMPDSRNYLFTDSVKLAGITDVLRVNTKNGENDWLTRTFCHISFVMRRRLEHKFPDLTIAILTSPRLIEAIQKTITDEAGDDATSSKISVVQRKCESRARALLLKMSARISNRLIRFTGWFLHKLLGCLLSSIVVHKGQMQLLQQFCKKEVPVIFLPTHRSHLDYILLTFVLFNYDLKAPYVAAGDNLLIPFFGSLMRGLGGFFIRRKLDKCTTKKDHIYRAVLHGYMEELLRNNEYLEFFVEGGRTRSGKSVYPKGGLLSVVVDAYANGVIPEAYLVPVSISYDKLVDGNFVKEQMGEPKVYETFWRAIVAIYKVLMGRYGLVRMDFSQPFSLKEYLQVSKKYPGQDDCSLLAKPGSPDSMVVTHRGKTNLKPTDSDMSMVQEGQEMRHIVQCLAEHVVYASVRVQSILSTHLLAFILLNDFRQGADMEVIAATFESLHQEVLARDHDVSFSGDTVPVLEHAVQLLGESLVRKVQVTKDVQNTEKKEFVTRLEPVTTLPHVLELSYYANIISPLFATESVLVNTIYSMLAFEKWTNLNSSSELVFSQRKLIQEASTLCTVLKYEFILCPPCQTIDQVLSSAFDRLRNCSILLNEEAIVGESGNTVKDLIWAKRFATHFDNQDSDSDEDFQVENNICKVNQEPDVLKKFWFIKRVISSVLETYYVAACHLLQLLTYDVTESDFVKSLHTILRERVVTGTASYAESIAMDTIKNAIRGFENAGVIFCYTEANVTMIGLTKDYHAEESLFTFIRMFESYRE